MGDAVDRVRGDRLLGISPEVKASIDGRQRTRGARPLEVSSLQHCRGGNGRQESAVQRLRLAAHLAICQMFAANRYARPFHIRDRPHAAFNQAQRTACGFRFAQRFSFPLLEAGSSRGQRACDARRHGLALSSDISTKLDGSMKPPTLEAKPESPRRPGEQNPFFTSEQSHSLFEVFAMKFPCAKQ
jgi:hypothetical protein